MPLISLGHFLLSHSTRRQKILTAYRPTQRQTLLLKTAACDPDTARRAWQDWNGLTDLDRATSQEVRLLASAGKRVAELDPTSPVLSRLRGARRYIFTRSQTTLAAVRPLLGRLAAAGVRMMLIKGAARVAEAPSIAAERTLQDVDVLIHHDDLAVAMALVEEAGWRAKLDNLWSDTGGLADRFAAFHAIGLRPPDPETSGSVDLHHFVVQMCRNIGDDDRLWQRSRPAEFLGVAVTLPSSTDAMMISLTHAMMYSKVDKTSDWALDAVAAIASGRIDWTVLLGEVRARQIEAFVAGPLLFLAEELQQDIPRTLLDALITAIDPIRLAEFEYLATGYFSHAKVKRHVVAARRMAISRAMAAPQRELVVHQPGARQVASRLERGELAIVDLPMTAGAGETLTLEIAFRPGAHWGRSSLLVRCPGLMLAVWRLYAPFSLIAPLARRRIVLDLPAALFAARGISMVGIQAGSRNTVSELSVAWRPSGGQAGRLGQPSSSSTS